MSCATGVNPSRKSERPQQQVGLDRSARCTGRPVLLASPRPPGRSVEPPPLRPRRATRSREARAGHHVAASTAAIGPRPLGAGIPPERTDDRCRCGAASTCACPPPPVASGCSARTTSSTSRRAGWAIRGAPSARGSYAPFFGGRRYCAAYGYRYVMPGAYVDVHKPTERDACGGDRSASPAPVRTAAWNPTGWSPGSGAPATRGGARHDREPGRGGRSRTGPAIRSASAPRRCTCCRPGTSRALSCATAPGTSPAEVGEPRLVDARTTLPARPARRTAAASSCSTGRSRSGIGAAEDRSRTCPAATAVDGSGRWPNDRVAGRAAALVR